MLINFFKQQILIIACEPQLERTQATTNYFYWLVESQQWHILNDVCVPQHQMLRQLIQKILQNYLYCSEVLIIVVIIIYCSTFTLHTHTRTHLHFSDSIEKTPALTGNSAGISDRKCASLPYISWNGLCLCCGVNFGS